MKQSNAVPGALLVLAAGVLWGTVGPAQVLADAPASPAVLGAARILSGGLILALIVLATAPRAFAGLRRTSWPPLLAAAIATAVFQAAFLTAVERTGAAVATAVVFGLAPVSTGACERIALRTRLTRRWTIGTACAVAGCALLTAPMSAGRPDPLGVALALLAGVCFGVYTVAARQLVLRRVGMVAAVAVTLLVGGALLLPWTFTGFAQLAAPRSLGLVAWLGPVVTSAAYMLFVGGLRRVSAATAGTLSLAEPLVAAVLAVLVLNERMPAPVMAGSLLLLGGLVVVSLPTRRPVAAQGGAPCTAKPDRVPAQPS
ncbi:DMT family transporter [Spirillospora sp. NPDC050679]